MRSISVSRLGIHAKYLCPAVLFIVIIAYHVTPGRETHVKTKSEIIERITYLFIFISPKRQQMSFLRDKGNYLIFIHALAVHPVVDLRSLCLE